MIRMQYACDEKDASRMFLFARFLLSVEIEVNLRERGEVEMESGKTGVVTSDMDVYLGEMSVELCGITNELNE